MLPSSYPFFFYKLGIVAVGLGVLSGIISTFISFKRKSFVIHSLSHVMLVSGIFAHYLGLPSALGEFLVNVLICNAINYAESNYDSTANLFVSMAGLNAIGILLLSKNQRLYVSPFYGSFWFMSSSQIVGIALLALAFVIFTAWWGKAYIMRSMSQELYEHVRTWSFPLMDFTFYTLLALACTLLAKATGIFLLNAILVLPGMIALQWVGDIIPNIWVSSGVSVGALVLSLLISANYKLALSTVLALILVGLYFARALYLAVNSGDS